MVRKVTHCRDVTELVPADREEFKGVNEVPYDGDVPEPEDDDGHRYNLRSS